MSVYVYDIAKKLGLENQEILAKAKEMGITATKHPSSSIDKISAQWLEEEIIKSNPALAARLLATKPVEETAFDIDPISLISSTRSSNFTPAATQVIALARKEAERLNHNTLHSVHLLLGLIKLGRGVTAAVLREMGVNLQVVREEAEKNFGRGSQPIKGNIPFTGNVKKVILLAQTEAKRLNHTYVGTEHLLLGLLQVNDGTAAAMLRALDVDLDRCRDRILSELDPNFISSQETKPATSKEQLKEITNEQVKAQNLTMRLGGRNHFTKMAGDRVHFSVPVHELVPRPG